MMIQWPTKALLLLAAAAAAEIQLEGGGVSSRVGGKD